MIDWKKISENPEVIKLIKEREAISEKIRAIDDMALINYELELLNETCPEIPQEEICYVGNNNPNYPAGTYDQK